LLAAFAVTMKIAFIAAASLLVVACGGQDERSPASATSSGTTVTGSGGAGGQGGAGTGGAGGEDACATLAAGLQSALDQVTTHPKGGTAMAVTTPECGSWAGTSGEAHDGVPLGPEHLLRTGSVTKTYVAVAILQLVADGEIDLDETLEPWVPGVLNGTTITIRQLLNHTSGVFSYTSDPTFFQQALADPTHEWAPQDLVDIAVQNGADFEPGTDWSYSNTNYILLGMILELATGKSVGEVLRELLDAHGLDATFLDGEEALVGELATGYAQTGADITQVLHPSAAWAAGSMVGTASDVADWAAALYRGQVLAEAEMDAMLTMVPTSSAGVEYGLGVFGFGPQVLAGQEGLGHGGDIPGYHTLMIYLTEHDTVVVSIVNSDAAAPESALGAALPLLVAP
jgi:D-alanyl-D-alanine carboxypeptidase